MSAILKKITTRAKSIRRAHPAMKWTAAIKQASREIKGMGSAKKTARKKTVTKKRAPKRSKTTTSFTRKVTRSVGGIGKGLSYHKAAIRKELKDKIATGMLKAYMTKRKPAKRKINKRVLKLKSELRKLG
jgi:hypothetical protein